MSISEKGITIGQKKSLHNLFKNQFLVTRENLNGMVVVKLVLLQKLFNQLINKSDCCITFTQKQILRYQKIVILCKQTH